MKAAMTGKSSSDLNSILAGLALLFIAHAGHASAAAASEVASPQAQAAANALAKEPPVVPPPGKRVVEDASGRNQVGKASVYARHFQGHRMADGERFRHAGSAAASRSLPLGTIAKVTNLETGKTATVTVEDHGPFARGRAIDVSSATAAQLGITRHEGVSQVEISPVAVPQRDGTVKPGAGAANGSFAPPS
jgi:rare lipoprotein A